MMIRQMAELTRSMLDSWQQSVDGQQGAIEVNKQFMELTADVISHSAFGSSYVLGKEVFWAQKELQGLFVASVNKFALPGSK